MARSAVAFVCVCSIALAQAGGDPLASTISVDPSAPLTTTSAALTSFTVDVCALKQGLNFSDPLLVALARNLAPAVLRIGGTDQNSFAYDMSDHAPMAPCACGHKTCTMTADYWAAIARFINSTGLQLLFGLNPASADNAASLVYHTAHQNYTGILGYSFGNEQTGDASLAKQYRAKLQRVRAAIAQAYPPARALPPAVPGARGCPHAAARPLLVGADTGVGPRKGTTPATMGSDSNINEHLAYIEAFAKECGGELDALTWHEYDYRAQEVGTLDHEPLPWPPAGRNVSRLFDPDYWAVAGRLADNVSAIARRAAPALAAQVWLTETNSICHQGTFNVTNAFFNTLWLVHRFGQMAQRGVQVMARQSLIGYNYSLLGNFPAEPIFAAPDYYATALFKRLAAPTVLSSSIVPAAAGAGSGAGASSRLLAFAYCSAQFGGGVTLTLINTDEDRPVGAALGAGLGGRQELYELAPAWPAAAGAASARERATSRRVSLNGGPALAVGAEGALPAFEPRRVPAPAAGAGGSSSVVVQPLTVLFAVLPDAAAPACRPKPKL
eukprot:g8214.t1